MSVVTTRRTPNIEPAGCRYACRRCGHHWNSRHPEQAAYIPKMCPCCGSAYWNVDRKRVPANQKDWGDRMKRKGSGK